MHRIFYNDNKAYMRIEEKEIVNHLVSALRIKKGETIELVDQNQVEHIYEVVKIEKKALEIQHLQTLELVRESDLDLVLFQGMPKGSKLEVIIQKTTELGIKAIYPIMSHRVNVKWDGKKNKVDRWNKIALEAAKQSKRLMVPLVNEPLKFDEVLEMVVDFDLFIVLYENESNMGLKEILRGQSYKKIGILVGPEGGLEESEVKALVEKGAKSVGLGPRILRTETVGVSVSSMIQYELGDINN